MWALDVDTPALNTFSKNSTNYSSKQKKQRKNHAGLNSRRDAARIAALKKLRHVVVQLSSASVKKPGGKPLSVLYFERWLARYSLRRELAIQKIRRDVTADNDQKRDTSFTGVNDDESHQELPTNTSHLDPLIPSDGVIDNGLIKDLSRSITLEEAKTIASTLTLKSQESAAQLYENHRGHDIINTDNPEDFVQVGRKRAKKDLKAAVKDIKDQSKVVQLALGDGGKNNSEDNNEEDHQTSNDDAYVLATLQGLRSTAQKLQESIQKAQRLVVTPISSTSPCGGISIHGTRRDGIYDVTVKGPNGKPNRPYLTVSKQHLCKLIQLWTIEQRHGSDIAPPDGTAKGRNCRLKVSGCLDFEFDPIHHISNLSETNQPQLRMAIYSCLSRYEALRGAGYQCAIPGDAFDAATSKCGLGVTIECFASPLNCRYNKFCSAFPDIESRFGSIGSFFDDEAFNPQQGSFEANPPFVPETMYAMGGKIQRLLNDQARGPLSFLVVVPAWGAGSDFCEKLIKSDNARANALIKAADHAYFDGSQHTKLVEPDGSLLRPSSWDTAVILLQNDAGKQKWPVAEELLKASFCGAFENAAKSVPDEFSTVQKWERRGVSEGGSSKQRGLSRKRKKFEP